jgi:predicted permease
MPEHIFFRRSRGEIRADNRAELEGWIDERADQLTAQGVDPSEARRRARDEFGDIADAESYALGQDLAAERRRRVRVWAEELGSDLRIALRVLARAPLVSAVVLLTFALGVGATTAVFSVFHALLLRPLPYGDEQTLVYLQALDKGVIGPNARLSVAALVALQERSTSFTGIAGIETGNFVISDNGDPEQVMGALLGGNAFEVLRTQVGLGRALGSVDATQTGQVVILSDELWRRRFDADPAVVGRKLAINDEQWQVVGVMPPHVRVPTYEEAQFWAPRNYSGTLADANARHVRAIRAFGRLKPGLSARTAQADVNRTMRALQAEFPRAYRDVDARVVPIRSAVAGDFKMRLLVVMSAAGFVLLIACANVAGMLLSRAIARRHELSVRIALGARTRRLVRQFLAEAFVLALIGVTLGLAIAQLGIVVLRRIAAPALPAGTTFALEPQVLLFAGAVALTSALVSSLFPALGAPHSGVSLLRYDRRASHSRGSRRVRLGLVIAQLAVSVVLLVGTGLFLRTLHRLSALDLGYSTKRALTFRLQFTRPRTNAEQDVFWSSLYEQLRALPGATAAGGGNIPLSGQNTTAGLQIEGRANDSERGPDVRYAVASPDYFSALGIPLVRGRTFTDADREGTPWVAVISAGLARQVWPNRDPIGVRVKAGEGKPWATIVGVVGDVRKGSIDPAQPSLYTAQLQDHWPGGGTVIMRTSGDPVALMENVREVVKKLDPALPVIGLRTLDDFRHNSPAIADRRLQMQLIMIFALLAMAVSAIGVFGVSAHAMEARRHEFGIRMALGSSPRDVLLLSLRDTAQVVMVGAAIGLPLALILAERLRDTLHVRPFDLSTVSAALGTVVLVALLASFVPARRATLIDPARTLRDD